jgi:hypothetical protein
MTSREKATKVNLDATAEALAEDPWADLMLDSSTKLAIVDVEVTNHADNDLLSLILSTDLVLENASGEEFTMDLVQIALDQDEVPNLEYPLEETVHAVAVYFIPVDSNATTTAVRLQTTRGVDVPTNVYIAAK